MFFPPIHAVGPTILALGPLPCAVLPPAQPAPRVLLIEQDTPFRTTMLGCLAEECMAVDIAADEAGGLALFNPTRHAIVIMNLLIPACGCLKILRRLRKRGEHTVLLAVSPAGAPELAGAAFLAGAFDVIPKPCSVDYVKAIVRKALEHRRLELRLLELERLVSDTKKDDGFV
ncbi:MAG: response regulator [Candidatus Lernaella stagnicola]|nr:response regulator [Candidatus Lernaella stagnicola]